MDMRKHRCPGFTWSRLSVLSWVALLLLAHLSQAAPAIDADSARLADAVLRLDDALDNLSAYFKDTKRELLEGTDDDDDDDDDVNTDPLPDLPELTKRRGNEDGLRPEFTAELGDDLTEKELSAVPDDLQQLASVGVEEAADEDRQDQVLRAALRYLLKAQKQERRQKKDYDIPFPIFGYKRGPASD